METVRFNKIYCPPSSFGLIKLTEHESGWILNNGTGIDQIATESNAYAVGKNSGVTIQDSKGCTKSRAVTLGCKVSGSYSDNQLVKYSDLSKSESGFTISWSGNSRYTMGTWTQGTGTPPMIVLSWAIERPGSAVLTTKDKDPVTKSYFQYGKEIRLFMQASIQSNWVSSDRILASEVVDGGSYDW